MGSHNAAWHGRRLRVLVVAPSMDILGGQAVQAARLLEHLQREVSLEAGFQPINPRWPGLLGRLQSIKYVRTVLTELLYVAQLLRNVRKYDIIHIFSASYLSFVLSPTPALAVARLYGKKSVLNYHSGEAADHLARWTTALPTIELANAVAVPSGYLAQVFAQFRIVTRTIFNFVDLDDYRYRERSPLRPVFLANRNLEPMYNVGCVLEAFAAIQRRYPEASLLVAGDGSQRHHLEIRARELGLRAEFLGRVPPRQMPALYDRADVYLNASEIDNMPLSILEASAAGLPVVSTDAGGIPHMVRNDVTGLLVACGDAGALAEQALALLADPARALALARAAREECRRYTWATVREQWLDLYHRLAQSQEPGWSADPAAA